MKTVNLKGLFMTTLAIYSIIHILFKFCLSSSVFLFGNLIKYHLFNNHTPKWISSDLFISYHQSKKLNFVMHISTDYFSIFILAIPTHNLKLAPKKSPKQMSNLLQEV